MNHMISTKDFVRQQGLLALLLAPLSALSLHVLRFPFWMLLFAAFIFVWRMQIYRGLWAFPSRWVRVALVATALAAVIFSHPQWYTLEPMVFLLMMAFLLKILEVREQRDAVVLIFVGYFVTASALLFDQGIIITVLSIVVVGLLTACLLMLQARVTRFLSKQTFKKVTVLITQAVPIMLLMFFVFPRIGALWSVPLQSASGVTGVSDSMSPGDFSQLSQSSEVAFRVSFENDQAPPPSDRYWRGLVLTEFDGRRWQRSSQQRFDLYDRSTESYNSTTNSTLNYEITLEATSNRWLYGIPLANIGDTSLSNNELIRNPYNELVLKEPIAQRLRYSVASSYHYNINESQEVLREALLLPRDFNPATIEQAQQWRQASSSVEDYINRVLQYYTDNFTYTLSPPVLGQHTADEFLFETLRGFCEHFSSSFVILMRAVGIPARVVVGYQGGEWNDEDNYLIVRQQEAHAWAEVWIDKRGWVRVDPTAAVAPDRIERNLVESLSATDQLLVDRGLLPSIDWINHLKLRWDSLNYDWQRWVLKYDNEQQSDLLEKLLGKVTPVRIAMLLLIPAMIFFAVFGLLMFRDAFKRETKEVKLYRCLSKKLSNKGIKPIEGETITQLCERASLVLPKAKQNLALIDKNFNSLLYASTNTNDKSRYLQHIQKLVKQL